MTNLMFSVKFNLSSANAFSLDKTKIVVSGIGIQQSPALTQHVQNMSAAQCRKL